MRNHTFFIVPYRDRESDLAAFRTYFSNLCSAKPLWAQGVKLIIVEQSDDRPFNRGALKNIGAIHVQRLGERNPTLVFHDVDTIPRYPLSIDYGANSGEVNHIYGNNDALGGIFSVKLHDFLNSGGFPNLWGWGYEDNVMTARMSKIGVSIDRSSKIRLTDYNRISRLDLASQPPTRDVCLRSLRSVRMGTCDGIPHLSNIRTTVDECFLKVHHFQSKFDSPPRLVTISSNVLRGNVLNTLFPKAKPMQMRFQKT